MESRFFRNFMVGLAPLMTVALTLGIFAFGGLYPFGDKSLAWGDMDQQFLPLLAEFLDILAGKEGFFLSMQNGGGINFFGVFFFFLCSPLNFLALLWERGDLALFLNVLILCKLTLLALTASLFFRIARPGLCPFAGAGLSVLYAFSGYSLMYYQNPMWLDVAALFPLLLLSAERLFDRGKGGWFGVLLAVQVMINLYLSFAVVCFLVLYAGIRLISLPDRKSKALLFLRASAGAAGVSAVVWLPMLAAYGASGRMRDVLSLLSGSSLTAPIWTTVPTIFCLFPLLPFVGYVFWKDRKNPLLVMFALTLIPLFLEPVNKMWQTGDYMAFPTRYAFLTLFCGLCLAADALSPGKALLPRENGVFEGLSGQKPSQKPGLAGRLCGTALMVGICLLLYRFSVSWLASQGETMDAYTSTLWGNEASFSALLRYYLAALFCGLCLFALSRSRWKFRQTVGGCLCLLAAVEAVFGSGVYVLPPAQKPTDFVAAMALADRIDDEDFYRVKMERKLFDVNWVGGMGYPSLAHYTSMTPKTLMDTAKKLGYSGYWMEIGSHGGTLLTDALFSHKYVISRPTGGESVFETQNYALTESPWVLPLGVTYRPGGETELPLHRLEAQNALSTLLFGRELLTAYEATSSSGILDQSREGVVSLAVSEAGTASLTYEIEVRGAKTLYFDLFDRVSNALQEEINGAATVYVNNRLAVANYPSQSCNGLVALGDFQNETVRVKVYLHKSFTCTSFGVYGLDRTALAEALQSRPSQGLTSSPNRLSGEITANGGESLLIALPFDAGFSATVNGRPVPTEEVFGLLSLPLEEGLNRVELVYRSPGTGAGSLLAGISLLLCGLWAAFCRRKAVCGLLSGRTGEKGAALFGALDRAESRLMRLSPAAGKLSLILTGLLAAGVFVLLYLFPLAVRLF